jgi:hypothetical protein
MQDSSQPQEPKPNKTSLRSFLALQANKTRRIQGRRAITPIRHKHHMAPAKTRSAIKAGKHGRVSKRASSDFCGERTGEDKTEHCEDTRQEGNQDSCSQGERKNAEGDEASEVSGNPKDSTESVHSGSFQAMRRLSSSSADTLASYETLPKEEERTTQ